MEKDSRGRLIAVATELFATKGYAAVSIRELAQAAQVNSALINYHFGGKDGLYVTILENTFSQIKEDVQNIMLENTLPLERLKLFMDNLVQVHTRNPYLKRLMCSELSNPTVHFDTVVKKYVLQFFQFAHDTIDAAIQSGDLRDDLNPAFTTFALAGMINFYFLAYPVVNALVEPSPDRDQAYLHNAQKIFLNGLIKKQTTF